MQVDRSDLHLAPGFLSEEVKKLDTFSLSAQSTERAKIRATCSRGPSTSGESGEFSQENWLLRLDSNQQPSG